MTCPQTGLTYHNARAAMAFRQALKAENEGDHAKAERFLNMAVRHDVPATQ